MRLEPVASSVRVATNAGLLVVLLILLAAVLLPGCANLALSSAERRAGFYRPETRLTYQPRTGEFEFSSSRDADFELDEASVGGAYVKGVRYKGIGSSVLRGQGERLTDNFVELMGQDIEYHRVVADWLVQTYGMTLQAATELAPIIGGMARQRIEQQRPSAGQQLRPYLEAAARELLARNGINLLPGTAGAGVAPSPAPATQPGVRVEGEGSATTEFVGPPG